VPRRSKHRKSSTSLNMTRHLLYIRLFPVANGALFVRKKSEFKIGILVLSSGLVVAAATIVLRMLLSSYVSNADSGRYGPSADCEFFFARRLAANIRRKVLG